MTPHPGQASPTDPAELRALEYLAVEVAAEAARFVVERRAAELEVSTKSSEVDVVTVMDSRSQELIAARLRAARPQDAFFGEEEPSGADPATGGPDLGGPGDDTPPSPAHRSGLTWVVDPIDGTVNYLYGFPQYAVSVALVEGDPQVPGAWRPLVGAVADAVAGEVHHARLGGGAWTRSAEGVEVPVHVSGATDLATSLVGTGFGYDAAKRGRQARALVEIPLPCGRPAEIPPECAESPDLRTEAGSRQESEQHGPDALLEGRPG